MDPMKVFVLFSGINVCFRLMYSLARFPAPRELCARTTTLYSGLGCNPIMLKDSSRAFMISGNGGLCGLQSMVYASTSSPPSDSGAFHITLISPGICAICKSVGLLGGVIRLERFEEGAGVLVGVGFWSADFSLLLLDVTV